MPKRGTRKLDESKFNRPGPWAFLCPRELCTVSPLGILIARPNLWILWYVEAHLRNTRALSRTLFRVLFEVVERHLRVLADLDQVAVGVPHITAPFVPVIVERLGEKDSSLGAPFFVASLNVGYSQIQEAVRSVWIRRRFEDHLGLIRRRPAPGIQNEPGVCQLDVARIFRLHHFPAKNSSVKILRFLLIPHSEKMRDVKSLVCNRRVRQFHATLLT